MQRAQQSSTGLVPEKDLPRPGLPPVVAFLILVLVLVLIAVGVFLARVDNEVQAAATQPAATQPNFALTNEAAIARFKDLSSSINEAYKNRDMTALELFLTDDSPLRERGEKEIRQLIRDGVVAVPVFERRSIEIVSNAPDEIVIREVSVDSSRFKSESGKDLTQNPRDILRVVEWTLQLDGSTWKIFDSDPVRSRVLR